MPQPIRGLHVPLVTPFTSSGRVDLVALERLAHHCLDEGAAGLVALGTTGEPATLTDAERDAVVDCCAAVCAARGALLTVAAGGNDTARAEVELDRRSQRKGVGAILSVVPPYSRPARAGIVAHFERLARASAVPLLVYEVPQRTGTRLGGKAMLALHAAHPRIAGVKLAPTALDADTAELVAAAPEGFAVLCGEDSLIQPLCASGAAGAIAASAHCATSRFAALIELAQAGEIAVARREAASLVPLARSLFAEPNPSVIKGVLHRRGLIATPDVRLPHVAASAVAVSAALEALDAVERAAATAPTAVASY
ncbi:MAG TPA: dihydrodipicolinate synthase family protein [Conexibacter sp.]|jgi:4-hydroxy-tetrahydrodipicolinate synthase